MQLWPQISLNDNVLHLDDVNLCDLAKKYSTPLFVISHKRILEQYWRFKNAFKSYKEKILVLYAYKANTHLAVCKTLANIGCGTDVVSEGELEIAVQSNVSPSKIVFSGTNKTLKELEIASDLGILMVNVDSDSELTKIQKLKRPLNIGIRVNPNIDANIHKHVAVGLKTSKFGINIDDGEAFNAYKRASTLKNITIKGIHCHIGSQITTVDPFISVCKKLLKFCNEIKDELSIEIEYLNLGGGLGVSYKEGDDVVSPEMYAKKIIETIHSTCEKYHLKVPKLILEPGRFIVSDSTIIVGTVGTIKKKLETSWAILDTGMTHLMRPVLYNAYHEIQVVNSVDRNKIEKYSISGPCCESGDYLAKDRELTEIKEGDLLAIFNAGAYGFTMSHNFNLQLKPNIIMICNGIDYLIREKETLDDLYLKERIPDVI